MFPSIAEVMEFVYKDTRWIPEGQHTQKKVTYDTFFNMIILVT